ncbi:MAG: hypothetical protein WAM27_02915, partial [Nitrososphaeraceae archaeon]
DISWSWEAWSNSPTRFAEEISIKLHRIKDLSGGNSSLTEEAKLELTERMEELLPGAGLSFLIAQSADPVAA